MSRLRSLRLRLAIVYAAVAALVLVVAYSAAGAALEAGLISSAAERLEIEASLRRRGRPVSPQTVRDAFVAIREDEAAREKVRR